MELIVVASKEEFENIAHYNSNDRLVMSSMSTQYTAGSQGSEVAGKSHEWKTPVSASSRAKRWSRRPSGPRWRLTSSFQDSPVDQDDMDYYGMVLANLINGKAYTNEKRSCIRRGGPCDHRPNDCCPKSSCRCNLWGTNCRCHRLGLFQKWGKKR
ncbi:hypothetical protein TYRP_013608 [Tyrophagus putrescentiae]|nr:hypothetical protein TYRP_013608 [Tyrophagus putrescentiae]